jgi:hypothetical protein
MSAAGRTTETVGLAAPALALLRVEMEALATVFSALPVFAGGQGADFHPEPVADPVIEAEVEAQFDNMPV